MSFNDLGLSVDLLKTISELGYVSPTPIQKEAIPQILRGRDLFACAQTGTGKTASFVLPLIDILSGGRTKSGMPRSIILEPTRELAAQVHDNFARYSEKHALKSALLVGGESMAEQEKIMRRGVDILICTPGRLLDLFDRGRILLTDVKFFVIDEADRMLDMGFTSDVDRIVSLLPKMRQTVLFSATFPDEIKKLAASYLMNPKEIIITPSAKTADTVTQYIINTPLDAKVKRAVLRKILQQQENLLACLIFCNRKKDVDIVTKSLKAHGFTAECLHGDMTQSRRNETLEDFKTNKFVILVASDVAARGIDVTGLNLVLNYDVPINPEDYVHRIGRTGRAGNSGTAITLVTAKEQKLMKFVEKLIQKEIPVMAVEIPDEELVKEVSAPTRRRTPRSTPSSVEKTAASPADQNIDKSSDRSLDRSIGNPPVSVRASTSSRTREPRGRYFDDTFSDTPVVGFGDMIPNFMRIEPLKGRIFNS